MVDALPHPQPSAPRHLLRHRCRSQQWLQAALVGGALTLGHGCAPHGAAAAGPDWPQTVAKGMLSDHDEPPAPQPAAQGEVTPSSTDASQVQRQLQIFSQIVLNPSIDIDAQTRRNAAHELLAMKSPEAIDILAQALRSEKAQMMQAIISAMQAVTDPPLGLMEPAISSLVTCPAGVLESLCWVVARYGDASLSPVMQLALDRDSKNTARFGPIAALSTFDSQKAAGALITIALNPHEPADIVAAACEGLQRLSGLSHGTDVAQWRNWWNEAGALPTRQWTAFITKSLSKRAAQLQQDLQKQREANERIARELFAVYRDLYPALPADEQLRRLPALLQAELAPVREFAISRISLLLRDSVRIPLELQQKIADRLQDESAPLRIAAAKLLEELNYEGASPLMAARLAQESSPQVALVLFDSLARRPCAEAVESARRSLTDAALSDRAAELLWRALAAGFLVSDGQDTVWADVRKAYASRASVGLARLVAALGDATDIDSLKTSLKTGDAALKSAIAEGLAWRGERQLLIEHSTDAAVFPFAVRAVAEGPADLTAFQLLVEWIPTDATRQTWLEGVNALIQRLAANTLLAADDVLANATHAEASLRVALLSRAASAPHDALLAEQRLMAIRRLAPLLIQQGEAARAFALLDVIDCTPGEIAELCFHAAALSGHYERAAQVEADPKAWVALLNSAAQRDLGSVNGLCQEITRRFNGQLGDEDRAIVNQISQRLRESASATDRAREL